MRHPSTPLRALAVLALLGATLHAGQVDDYLARNLRKFAPGDEIPAGLLDPAGKRVFLLGEAHAVAGMEMVDLAMLRYLHRTAGVRFYVDEAGYAFGELTNRYLSTGDEKLLEFLTEQLRGSPAWNRENRDFLHRLGEWNRGLPPADRVRFVGVDVDHQRSIAWRYLSELTGDAGAAPEAIRDVMARLGRPGGNDQLDSDLAASLAAHRPDYAALLGARLADFELVTANLQKRDEFYRTNSNAIRDRVMYDTFRQVQARYPGARWYGRFGGAHVLQRPSLGVDPFAAMLQKDPDWADKIVSIWPIYWNCFQLVSSSYRSVPVTLPGSDTAPFEAAAGDSPVALFRLDAVGSPLRNPKVRLLGLGSGAVTDYVQYVLLMQNAPAAHPLHEVPPPPAIATAPPVVVRTVPEAGTRDVDPGLREIRVTFSKEMKDGAYSFAGASGFAIPPMGGDPRFEAGYRTVVLPVKLEAGYRTVVLPVKLEAGKTYGVWINHGQYMNFQDRQGQPAVPYLLVFQTRER